MSNPFAEKFLVAVLCLLCAVWGGQTFAANRGIMEVSVKDKEGNEVALYKESHALVIGASQYSKGWPALPGVKKDVQLVKSALEKKGFNVVVVQDPDRSKMISAFEDFINKYGQAVDNRLVFYFAGHGHTLELSYGGEMGYIVPVEAPNPNRDKEGFLAKAIDMQLIEVFAKRIQSKHALFLFDSCFSGSLFAMSRAIPDNISYKTNNHVRQFITAGSANETVPDVSVFREQFISALEGEGDVDGDGYVTGVELGEFLQKTVVNYTKGYQHPQYGKIRDRNLDKGDFVFTIKTASLTTKPTEPIIKESKPAPAPEPTPQPTHSIIERTPEPKPIFVAPVENEKEKDKSKSNKFSKLGKCKTFVFVKARKCQKKCARHPKRFACLKRCQKWKQKHLSKC